VLRTNAIRRLNAALTSWLRICTSAAANAGLEIPGCSVRDVNGIRALSGRTGEELDLPDRTLGLDAGRIGFQDR